MNGAQLLIALAIMSGTILGACFLVWALLAWRGRAR